MALPLWFRCLRPAGRGAARQGGRGPRLRVELLEERCLLTSVGIPPFLDHVAGDFNGDGFPDAAVLVYDRNAVEVELANAHGFYRTLYFAVGRGPVALVVGDFNRDGLLDLASVNELSNDVTVLLGQGDGTFRHGTTVPVGAFPQDLVVADFNGDGVPDLAVVNEDSDNVSVLLGQGDGTFRTAATIGVGKGPVSLVSGDFNGDGIPDLAVADESGITLLQGRGDGTFTQSATLPVVGLPSSVAAGDFNGDGILDLATANEDPNGVTVLLGQGGGGFAPGRTIPVHKRPDVLVTADLTGAGVLDLVAISFTGVHTDTDAVLLGRGDGTFEYVGDYQVAYQLHLQGSQFVELLHLPLTALPLIAGSTIPPAGVVVTPQLASPAVSGGAPGTSISLASRTVTPTAASSGKAEVPVLESSGPAASAGQAVEGLADDRLNVVPSSLLSSRGDPGLPPREDVPSGVMLVGTLLTGERLTGKLLPQKGSSIAHVGLIVPGEEVPARTGLATDQGSVEPDFVIGLDDTIHRPRRTPGKKRAATGQDGHSRLEKPATLEPTSPWTGVRSTLQVGLAVVLSLAPLAGIDCAAWWQRCRSGTGDRTSVAHRARAFSWLRS